MEKLTKWEQVRSRQIEWKYSQVLWVRFFCPVLFGFLDDLQKEAQLESVRVTDFLRIMRITKNSNRKKEEERVTERKSNRVMMGKERGKAQGRNKRKGMKGNHMAE